LIARALRKKLRYGMTELLRTESRIGLRVPDFVVRQPNLRLVPKKNLIPNSRMGEPRASSSPNQDCVRIAALAPEHGIRNTFRLSLRRRLHLELTPRGRGDRTIRWTIGDAFECVSYAGQLERNLVGSGRSLQHHDSFSAEVKGRPEQQTGQHGNAHHQNVVARDGEAFAGDSDQVI
jgi:hypothetical protein